MPRYLATYMAQCVIELEAATKTEADTFALDLFSQPGVIWDNSMHDPVVTEVCVAEKAEGKGNG